MGYYRPVSSKTKSWADLDRPHFIIDEDIFPSGRTVCPDI